MPHIETDGETVTDTETDKLGLLVTFADNVGGTVAEDDTVIETLVVAESVAYKLSEAEGVAVDDKLVVIELELVGVDGTVELTDKLDEPVPERVDVIEGPEGCDEAVASFERTVADGVYEAAEAVESPDFVAHGDALLDVVCVIEEVAVAQAVGETVADAETVTVAEVDDEAVDEPDWVAVFEPVPVSVVVRVNDSNIEPDGVPVDSTVDETEVEVHADADGVLDGEAVLVCVALVVAAVERLAVDDAVSETVMEELDEPDRVLVDVDDEERVASALGDAVAVVVLD